MLVKEVQKQCKKRFLMHKDIKIKHIINSPDKKLKIKSSKESEKRQRLHLTNTGGKKTVSCGQLGCVLDWHDKVLVLSRRQGWRV